MTRKAFFQNTSWRWKPKWKQRMRWDYACRVEHVLGAIQYKQDHVRRTRVLKPVTRNWRAGEFCWPVRTKIHNDENGNAYPGLSKERSREASPLKVSSVPSTTERNTPTKTRLMSTFGSSRHFVLISEWEKETHHLCSYRPSREYWAQLFVDCLW